MMGRKALESDLLEAARKSPARGPWLVIFPASGTVCRHEGALLAVDLGGESRLSPFIVNPDSGVALAIDPRALIVHDRTLAVAWQPRDNLDRVHAMAGEWYARNPDVFCPQTRSGLTRI